MEAIAALGFAANVVQFVEFTAKIISHTVIIYNSKSQNNANATDLEDIGLRIERYVAPLQFHDAIKDYLNGKPWVKQSPDDKATSKRKRRKGREALMQDEDLEVHSKLEQSDAITRLSNCDRDILRTCMECESIAFTLQQALMKLRGTRKTIWHSFAEALRTVWSDTELQTLRNKLGDFRKQMNMLLLVSVREKVEASRLTQNELQTDLYVSTKQIRDRIDRLFSVQEQWKAQIIEIIERDHQRHYTSDDPKHPSATCLQTSLSAQSQLIFNNSLRNWIRFIDIETRSEKIAKAHAETFEWIFRPPIDGQWSDFPFWLESDDENLYWISGKPAAGKSTLLKFVYNDMRTKDHLKKWAKDKRLINCACYLWNSGTQMQMSEEGMLRTLLHAALVQAPELGAELFPSKMEEFILFADPWIRPITSEEVKNAFDLLLNRSGTTYKLFLFIDGLDEFDGDHGTLATKIRKLASPNIKTCVSSRDWPVFEDEFRQKPRLRLEAITYGDIKHYVTSRFSNSPGYLERRLETPFEVEELIENITRKASGVFLWVRLVTDSLLKGLENGDRLEELQSRLEAIPADLERLFWNILTHAEKDHSTNMSQLFQIMRRTEEPLTVLDLSYADDDDPKVILKVQYGLPDSQQAEGRAKRMRRRLKTCCKGLLEAEPEKNQPVASAIVTYLHRTVRDYVERPEIWSKLLAMNDDTFNLSHRMYNMYVIRVKMMYKVIPNFEKDFWGAVLHAIEYARDADPDNDSGLQISLLEQLDEIASYSAKPRHPQNPQMHWSSLRKGGQMNTSFTHLAIQLQLHEYVEQALPKSPTTPTDSIKTERDMADMLLIATLHYDLFAKDSYLSHLTIVPTSPSAELVALFLERGANPNLRIPDAMQTHGNITGEYSAWEVHLREPDREAETWAEISELFLRYGADPAPVNNATVNIPPKIVSLAQQKAKERRDELKKQKMKKFGSLFQVGKWKVVVKS